MGRIGLAFIVGLTAEGGLMAGAGLVECFKQLLIS